MFYDNVPGTKLRIRRAFVHTNPAYEIMCLIEVCTDSSGYTSYPIACVASVSNRVTARKLERKRKTKRWKREGKERIGSFFPLPLPRHSFFFLLSSRRSRRTRAETLATQATYPITFLISRKEPFSQWFSTVNK